MDHTPEQKKLYEDAEKELEVLNKEFSDLRAEIMTLAVRVRRLGYTVTIRGGKQSMEVFHVTTVGRQYQEFVRGSKKDLYEMSVLKSIFCEIVGIK